VVAIANKAADAWSASAASFFDSPAPAKQESRVIGNYPSGFS
jgi:hypothetical protein